MLDQRSGAIPVAHYTNAYVCISEFLCVLADTSISNASAYESNCYEYYELTQPQMVSAETESDRVCLRGQYERSSMFTKRMPGQGGRYEL